MQDYFSNFILIIPKIIDYREVLYNAQKFYT